jgi:hypothetical protein
LWKVHSWRSRQVSKDYLMAKNESTCMPSRAITSVPQRFAPIAHRFSAAEPPRTGSSGPRRPCTGAEQPRAEL